MSPYSIREGFVWFLTDLWSWAGLQVESQNSVYRRRISIQKENWLSSCESLQHFAEVVSVCTMSIQLLLKCSWKLTLQTCHLRNKEIAKSSHTFSTWSDWPVLLVLEAAFVNVEMYSPNFLLYLALDSCWQLFREFTELCADNSGKFRKYYRKWKPNDFAYPINVVILVENYFFL